MERFNNYIGRRIEKVDAAYLYANNGDSSHSDKNLSSSEDSKSEQKIIIDDFDQRRKVIHAPQKRLSLLDEDEDFKDGFRFGNFAVTEQIQQNKKLVPQRIGKPSKQKLRGEQYDNPIKEAKSESLQNYISNNKISPVDLQLVQDIQQEQQDNEVEDPVRGPSLCTPNGYAESSNKRTVTVIKRKTKRKTRYPKQSGQNTDQIVAQMMQMTMKPNKKPGKKSYTQVNRSKTKPPPQTSGVQKSLNQKRDNSGPSENQGRSGTSHESSSENRVRPALQQPTKKESFSQKNNESAGFRYRSVVTIQNKNPIKGSLTRGRMVLEQKAVEIAEKAKNNVINFWNIFVNDNGKPYSESYKVIKKIGQGGCGEVFMVMHLATDQIRAMKVVNKATDKVVKTIYDELNVLKSLDHPGIVKIFEYFQDDKNLYVVMEYLKGGSVFDRMKVIGRFGERESAYIMKQVLQALNYCCERRIVHRDLKLENILFSHEEQLQVKIVDFGSAINLEQYSPKKTNRIITSYYVAPEVVNKDENIIKCDVWSSGVILFILLSGSLPFKGNNENEIFDKVVKGQFNFDDPQWKYVSSKAKFLIKDMLDVDVQTRVSLFKCIDSPWIKMLTKIDGSFRIDGQRLQKAFTKLQDFQPVCKFRILMLHFALNYFYFESQTEKLSRVYLYLDQRQVGSLNEKEIMKFAQRIYRDIDFNELLERQTEIINKLDFRKEGGIAYSDFLIACMDFQKLLSYQKITKIFQLSDKDSDGYISIKDLHNFTGKVLPMDQCHSLLRECLQILDYSNDKYVNSPICDISDIPSEQMKLSFSQFKSIVLNQGLVLKDPSIIDRNAKINKTSPHLMLIQGFNSHGQEKNSKQQAMSVFMLKEDFKNARQKNLILPEQSSLKRDSSKNNENKTPHINSSEGAALGQAVGNHMPISLVINNQNQFSGGGLQLTNQVLLQNPNVNITTDDSKDQLDGSPKQQKTQKTKKSQKKLNQIANSITRKRVVEKNSVDK